MERKIIVQALKRSFSTQSAPSTQPACDPSCATGTPLRCIATNAPPTCRTGWLGSDRYRYRLIAEGFGTYADCDIFCLRPITETPYIMGAERENFVNGAILNYPPNSPFSELLREATQNYHFIPPWFRESRQRRMKRARIFGKKVSVEALGWGIWGPHLITHLVKRLDLWTEVSKIDRFYPLYCQHAVQLSDPELCIADLTTPRTDALHLWHKISGSTAPPGSPLDEIINC